MWRLLLVALASLLVLSTQGADRHGVGFMKNDPLREFCTVLEGVRAKTISEKEAVFSFGFRGETKEFLLVKNEEIDPRARRAYRGIDSTGFQTTLGIVFGGWERPQVFFFFFFFIILFFSFFLFFFFSFFLFFFFSFFLFFFFSFFLFFFFPDPSLFAVEWFHQN